MSERLAPPEHDPEDSYRELTEVTITRLLQAYDFMFLNQADLYTFGDIPHRAAFSEYIARMLGTDQSLQAEAVAAMQRYLPAPVDSADLIPAFGAFTDYGEDGLQQATQVVPFELELAVRTIELEGMDFTNLLSPYVESLESFAQLLLTSIEKRFAIPVEGTLQQATMLTDFHNPATAFQQLSTEIPGVLSINGVRRFAIAIPRSLLGQLKKQYRMKITELDDQEINLAQFVIQGDADASSALSSKVFRDRDLCQFYLLTCLRHVQEQRLLEVGAVFLQAAERKLAWAQSEEARLNGPLRQHFFALLRNAALEKPLKVDLLNRGKVANRDTVSDAPAVSETGYTRELHRFLIKPHVDPHAVSITWFMPGLRTNAQFDALQAGNVRFEYESTVRINTSTGFFESEASRKADAEPEFKVLEGDRTPVHRLFNQIAICTVSDLLLHGPAAALDAQRVLPELMAARSLGEFLGIVGRDQLFSVPDVQVQMAWG